MSPTFLDCWKGMRLKELEIVSGLDDAALCRRYAGVY
jgi:hypothetical protein